MIRSKRIIFTLLFFVSVTVLKQAFAEEPSVKAEAAAQDAVQTLTLDQCIASALEKNPGLQIEREKIIELQNDYRIAAANLYPKVSISAYYQRLDSDRLGTLPAMAYDEETLAQAKVKQVLFDGGRTWFNRRAAARGQEAQTESAEGSRLDTIFIVSQAFYRVLESQELLGVSENSRHQREEFSKLTESFRRAGRATKLETLKAEAQLLDAERSLSQAREARRLSELILKKIIGMDLQTKIRVSDGLPEQLPEPGDEETLLREALANNPDIKKISLQKEQSEASLNAAYGGYLPEISLQGTYGYRDRDTASWTSEWTAGVFLEWSLFEGGLTRAQAGKARSKVNQMAWNERSVRDQVQVDLREALGNLRTALAAVRSSRRLVEAQDESYNAAMMFYQRGKSTYLEVLSAQVDLTMAKASYVRAVGDYQNASAKLDRVIGKTNDRGTETRESGEAEMRGNRETGKFVQGGQS